MGACMLVRRAAIDEVGPPDRASSCSARRSTGAIASRRRAGRRSSRPARSACTSAAPRTAGRLYRDNLRGHLRFFLKHHGAAQAERVRSLLAPRARAPRQVVPRRERARCTATPPRWLGSGDVALADRAMSSVFLLVRLAVATGLVLAPGAIVARAVGRAEHVGDARLGRSRSSSARWSSCSSSHASLTLALVLLLVAALVAPPFASAARWRRRIPGRGGVWAAGRCSGCCSGTSPARSAATASSTSRACGSSSSSATSRSTP